MNKHAMIPLAIGLIVGIFALKLGYDYMNNLKSQGGNDMGPTAKVVVAGKDVPLGTKLTEADVTTVLMPKKLLPEGTFADPKEVIGQSLKASVSGKMPILKDMVGPGEGLEGIIPSGYRAVAVKVDEFTSVAGLLRPGSKVDVMATFNFRKDGGGSETISKLVLQDVEVRAVGQEYRSENMENVSAKVKPSRSVTLLVKSEQAEALQLAASTGTIRLALRSATEDSSPSQSKGMTLSQLLRLNGQGEHPTTSGSLEKLFAFLSSPKATQAVHKTPQVKKDEPFVVEVLAGNQTETIYFASANSDRRVNPKLTSEPTQDQPETSATDLAVVPE
jgi:pilus assembly protein CpaB